MDGSLTFSGYFLSSKRGAGRVVLHWASTPRDNEIGIEFLLY